MILGKIRNCLWKIRAFLGIWTFWVIFLGILGRLEKIRIFLGILEPLESLQVEKGCNSNKSNPKFTKTYSGHLHIGSKLFVIFH